LFSIFLLDSKIVFLLPSISKISITGGFRNLKGKPIIPSQEVTKSCVYFSCVNHLSKSHFTGRANLYKNGILICHQ